MKVQLKDHTLCVHRDGLIEFATSGEAMAGDTVIRWRYQRPNEWSQVVLTSCFTCSTQSATSVQPTKQVLLVLEHFGMTKEAAGQVLAVAIGRTPVEPRCAC